MATRFLDTNILIRLLTRDDEEKAARALALVLRVERGDEQVTTSPMVIFEIIFILEKRYQVPRVKIRDDIHYILSLRGVRLTNKKLYQTALSLYAGTKLSFADAYNAEFMKSRRLSQIYSWDRDFDKLDGIERVEPAIAPNA